MIASMDQACQVAREYALAVKSLRVHDARHARDAAQRQAAHADRTCAQRQAAEDLKRQLAAFVAANPHMFQSPRTVKTPFAEFGLRTATELVISDDSTLIEAILERGYDDCLEIVRKPIKPALKKRIASGESFPGAAVNTGDTVVCKVNSEILEQADQEAEA
jgi:hypothetical protein